MHIFASDVIIRIKITTIREMKDTNIKHTTNLTLQQG
jgi:hypothetical protein